MTDTSDTAAAVEKFLAENEVDERAGAALRRAAPDVQRQVLERGSLVDCKNASAALMVRINGSAANKPTGLAGLTGKEMEGTPEEVWARIKARNQGAPADMTFGGYGAAPADASQQSAVQQIAAAQLAAAQIAAAQQQQQQFALHLYYQQMAAQQAQIAALSQQFQGAAQATLPGVLPCEPALTPAAPGVEGAVSETVSNPPLVQGSSTQLTTPGLSLDEGAAGHVPTQLITPGYGKAPDLSAGLALRAAPY